MESIKLAKDTCINHVVQIRNCCPLALKDIKDGLIVPISYIIGGASLSLCWKLATIAAIYTKGDKKLRT